MNGVDPVFAQIGGSWRVGSGSASRALRSASGRKAGDASTAASARDARPDRDLSCGTAPMSAWAVTGRAVRGPGRQEQCP